MIKLFFRLIVVVLFVSLAQLGMAAGDNFVLSVVVNPNTQTVKVRGTPANPAVDLATYYVTASYDPNAFANKEIKPGDIIEWETLSASFKFTGEGPAPASSPVAAVDKANKKIEVYSTTAGQGK